MTQKDIFPKNFLWGGSTASHQVEGGTHNQWTVWEAKHAKRLAKHAERRLGKLASWEKVADQAQDPDNYISGDGVDHYNRYAEDFDIVQALNMNAHRFGIEWSRLEPKEGEWDESAVEHYREYIRDLRERGIEPFVNIWHWTNPVWFEKKGGFKKRGNIKYFARFVEKVSKEYGVELSYVITLNEPNVYTSFSYLTGEWPPQEKNVFAATWVYFNLVKAHKKAYKILKSDHPHLEVGIAAQLGNIQAKRPRNLVDVLVTRIMRYAWNWWFLRQIRRHQDFVGINYYFTDYYRNFKRQNPTIPVNDLGWYMEPEGIYPLLLRAQSHFKKPIYITENGVADMDDEYRRWWLEETIVAMERALSEGVDLRGYFHWSLLDNFEWAYGWWPKFGLVEVDRKNHMQRTIRPSAKWFADFIRQVR